MRRRQTTQGFAEMEKALAELTKATARNVLVRAGTKALEPVAETMRTKAPEDAGDLKEAIDVGTKRPAKVKRHFNDSRTVEIYAGVKVVGRGMPPQGTQQEFGNERHGPQPFARPAWDQEQRPTLGRVGDELKPELDKAVARARRKAMKAKG